MASHVILIKAGVRFPGYLSTSADLKFEDVPAGALASLEAFPTAAWLQIMVTTRMMETGYFLRGADRRREAGDIGGDSRVRYDDPEVKEFKLNAKRQNGRAAMMGITGVLIHELLGVDGLYPTGGMGGDAPRPSSSCLLSLGSRVKSVPYYTQKTQNSFAKKRCPCLVV